MDKSFFNKQTAAELYRKWYIIEKKDPYQKYDNEQIKDLHSLLLKAYTPFISILKRNQNLRTFRIVIPVLYIGKNRIEIFSNEMLILKNNFYSMNIPGCMSFGTNIEEAFCNHIFALIECSDARCRYGMSFMNIVHTMNYMNTEKDIGRDVYLRELIMCGWDIQYEGLKNTVLLKKGNEVTYTLPRTDVINPFMVHWFNQLQLQISASTSRSLYGDLF